MPIDIKNNSDISFLEIIDSFYGSTSGNINSPVWVCGLEWGGGYNLNYPISINDFIPYDFECLQCLDTEDFKNCFWAPRSVFCRSIIKILLAIRHSGYQNDMYTNDFKKLEAEQIVGRNGLALILNTFPISLKNHNSTKSWQELKLRRSDGSVVSLADWSNCRNFEEYKNIVKKHRLAVFEKERKRRRPKIIIACGDDAGHIFIPEVEWDNADIKFSSRNDDQYDIKCHWLKNTNNPKEDTLLVRQPFPSGTAFNANDQFNNTYTKVCKLCHDRFGVNWLDLKEDHEIENDKSVDDKLKKLKNLIGIRSDLQQLTEDICRAITNSDNLLNKTKQEDTSFAYYFSEAQSEVEQLHGLRAKLVAHYKSANDLLKILICKEQEEHHRLCKALDKTKDNTET